MHGEIRRIADAAEKKCLIMEEQDILERKKHGTTIFQITPDDPESQEYFSIIKEAAIARAREKRQPNILCH